MWEEDSRYCPEAAGPCIQGYSVSSSVARSRLKENQDEGSFGCTGPVDSPEKAESLMVAIMA